MDSQWRASVSYSEKTIGGFILQWFLGVFLYLSVWDTFLIRVHVDFSAMAVTIQIQFNSDFLI